MSASINWRSATTATFERQAAWRREKAEQHPEDRRRNLDAAAIFDRLADDMRAGRWNMGIFFTFGRMSYEASDDDLHRRTEIEGELLREVGFSFHPATADDFMREAITRYEREAAL